MPTEIFELQSSFNLTLCNWRWHWPDCMSAIIRQSTTKKIKFKIEKFGDEAQVWIDQTQTEKEFLDAHMAMCGTCYMQGK